MWWLGSDDDSQYKRKEMIKRMSGKKKEQLERTVNAIKELDEAGGERLATLAEGMAIQKSLAVKNNVEGVEKGDQK